MKSSTERHKEGKQNISIGKYIGQTLVTDVLMVSVMGTGIAFFMGLDRRNSITIVICFLLAVINQSGTGM